VGFAVMYFAVLTKKRKGYNIRSEARLAVRRDRWDPPLIESHPPLKRRPN
jgi:hypothetical protein